MDRDGVAAMHRAYAVAMAWPSPSPPTGWKKTERNEKREESKWPPARLTAFLQDPRRAGGCNKKENSDLREKKEERRVKREERDTHDRDERVEGGNCSVLEWRDGTERVGP